MVVSTRPESDADLFSDGSLESPYSSYTELRDAGAAVWMRRLGMFALPRYAEVREALENWPRYSSAQGVFVNEQVNGIAGGVLTLCTDPPEHEEMRRVLRRPLMPKGLQDIAPEIRSEAQALVDRLVARGTFDAVTDLAHHLPLTIVSKLVGIPEHGRENMLDWASAAFDSMGPREDRALEALPKAIAMMEFGATEAVPPNLDPDGWAQRLYDAAARGEVAAERCPMMMTDYLGPSLDTTINATSSAILLFGRHPDQWDAVREDRALIPNAINEVLRLESPIPWFARVATEDHDIDAVHVPAGSRVVLLFASANRDERKFEDSDRFDVRRGNARDHLAFGHGEHNCVGQGLARLELRALLEALADAVERFELGVAVRAHNQNLRGMERLEVTVR
jgi:cytochrome P450